MRCLILLLVLSVAACGGALPPAQTASDDAVQDASSDVALADTTTAETAADAQADVPDASADVPLPVCPSPVIEVLEGDVVVPQTVLHLKGDQSVAGSGATIAGYKWTVKQPTGSMQTFLPSATYADPTFVANVGGEYTFCLDVTDNNGLSACTPACVTVTVIPTDELHIELVWDTPADPDQTDRGPALGADMDLHFASDLSQNPDVDCDGAPDPWFDSTFDCFWYNPAPQWGAADPNVYDNPTLDLDDTDGAGPENLNLTQPEGTAANPRWYAIGVHYKNDNGFGVSYATVVVYAFGAIALQVAKVPMNMLDMWYVGKLNWPNQLTGTSTPPLDICYQTTGSKPGDVCAGNAKMWQPKGEWCITPKYATP